MSATTRSDEEPTPGERMDAREKVVLYLLFSDPVPWSIEELGRELQDQGDAQDAVAALACAGLVHRLPIVFRGEETEFVIPTRAARRADELHEGSI